MDSIYSFLDYRDYLKYHFDESKKESSVFSFRYVTAKTGIDSGFYSKILSKQKHLGEDRVEVLADFLSLVGKERDYFLTLIYYNRARSESVRQELFGTLVSLKQSAGTMIEDYRYFSEWYTIPVREILSHFDFIDDYAALAKQFSPAITERQASNAIRTLTELSMIAPDEQGFLRPTENNLTTGDQWRSEAVRRFQRQMIILASDSIERFPKESRDISTITLSTSKRSLDRIRERMAQARREIVEIIASEDEVDGVYQINMQVFPLTGGTL